MSLPSPATMSRQISFTWNLSVSWVPPPRKVHSQDHHTQLGATGALVAGLVGLRGIVARANVTDAGTIVPHWHVDWHRNDSG